jgi:hypothetical protein
MGGKQDAVRNARNWPEQRPVPDAVCFVPFWAAERGIPGIPDCTRTEFITMLFTVKKENGGSTCVPRIFLTQCFFPSSILLNYDSQS